MESDRDDGRFRRKEHARRSALDHDISREEIARQARRGPAIGKHTLVEDSAAGYTAADALAFFDRAAGEARAQLAALDGAITAGDRLAAATAASSLRTCLATARRHLEHVSAAALAERQPLLVELEARARSALREAHEAGILAAPPSRPEPAPAEHDRDRAGPPRRNEPGPPRIPAAMRDAIATETGGQLPDTAAWSRRLETDLSGARLVTGPKAQAAAASIEAPAFTVGNRIFLGAGITPAHEDVMRHELTHVAQQRGAPMPAVDELEVTSPEQHVEQEARGAEVGDRGAAPIAATGEVRIAPYGFLGRMGPGGGSGIPGRRNLQIDAFKYFERHGKQHFAELKAQHLGMPTLETGSPYATWASGRASTFAYWFAQELLLQISSRRLWDLLQETLAPADVWQVIDAGRDAANVDDPVQANECQLGVTLEIQKAYRERLREALARLMPRIIQEWNRRTLAEHAERSKTASIRVPEHPEPNYPGTEIVQSHPIDRHVLAALSVSGFPLVRPDFPAYRRAFPAEGAPRGPRTRPIELRKVRFEWQAPNQARRWIRVIDPIDASSEEVARELFGDTRLAYLVTAAPPLFGCDIGSRSFVPRYEKELATFSSSKGAAPADEVLSGPLADDAALNQAAGFTTASASPAAVLQQFEILVRRLHAIAAEAASWITFDKDVHEAIVRVLARKQKIAAAADRTEADRWNPQVREQLDIAGKCERAISILGKLFRSNPDAKDGRDLAWEIGTLYFRAAARSDLVATARQQLDHANQRLLALPADWVEAQFRWIRRAILASKKNARTGKDEPFVKQLDEKEAKLRLELTRVRDKLLSEPLAVRDELDRLTRQLEALATAAAVARNVDACNETFVALKEAKSPTGWIRSLASNPATGDHGNDRLDALARRAEKFQAEWDAILALWKAGKQDEAANALEAKASTAEWKRFFQDVAREIKDQARYDAWMTFGLLVGIAIVTGFAGALLEPVAAAAVGPLLGFVVTFTTEAALFTTMSYFLVDKHPSLQGFRSELAKNVVVFGVLKGIGKGWGALERLLGVEMRQGEMIAQFATLNGIALYEANRDKAKRGETLTEGEILKISFDNLIFTIAVAIGGKALAPALGRWRLRGKVGQELARVESIHHELAALAGQVKATKDKAAAEKLLERQRELLEAKRRFLEGILDLTKKGWDHARKLGMTREQYDAVHAAEAGLATASRGLREAEIMSRLEPVTSDQYLCEPGKRFDEARDHYLADKRNKVTETAGDGGIRSFEVLLPDGSKLRVSERAGSPGEVTTATRSVAKPGGEPPPPRPEEVAKAYGIDGAHAKLFEALYTANAPRLLEWLSALRSRPGLANRLLAKFGESALEHFRPLRDGMVSIHGELEISAAKLETLGDADLAKLVKVCDARGPAAEYEYFESSSMKDDKPGARLRFKSRLEARSKLVAKTILDSLGIKLDDPRARLFEGMSEGEAIRLWDLFNERGYKHAAIRKQAAAWALNKSPKAGGKKTVREFVAEFQFYEAEVANDGAKLFVDTKAELAMELAKQATAKGRPLTDAETKSVTKTVTSKRLGRALDAMSRAAERAAIEKTLENKAEGVTRPDGTTTTAGENAADLAWKTNVDAQAGPKAAGPRHIDPRTDAELPTHIRSIAETLSFGHEADGAYHAHKHARELSTHAPPATEMVMYLEAARRFIRDNVGVVRQNQNGSRSVVFEANGTRAIVTVNIEGGASIATYGKN